MGFTDNPQDEKLAPKDMQEWRDQLRELIGYDHYSLETLPTREQRDRYFDQLCEAHDAKLDALNYAALQQRLEATDIIIDRAYALADYLHSFKDRRAALIDTQILTTAAWYLDHHALITNEAENLKDRLEAKRRQTLLT